MFHGDFRVEIMCMKQDKIWGKRLIGVAEAVHLGSNKFHWISAQSGRNLLHFFSGII